MGKMKMVKEVCKLTGLNRKQLYLYDKEGIVKPSGYGTNGYEGFVKKSGVKVNYSGYKLYDEEAVMKLQQIAIYEKLRVKRRDIKARFASKKNSEELLDEQIQMLQNEKQKIEELLIVAEQLKLLGMKGELAKYYTSIDFSVFAHNSTQWETSKSKQIFDAILEKDSCDFEVEADGVLDELMSLPLEECESEKARTIVKKLLAIAQNHYGFVGWVTVVAMAVAADGGGEVTANIVIELGEQPVKNLSKAVMSYLKYDMDILWDEYIAVLVKYHDVIGNDYSASGVKKIVEEVRGLLYAHTGLKTNDEYEIFFEFIRIASIAKGSAYMKFVLDAMEYYHKNVE